MEDLMSSFAQQDIESPTRAAYIYHFIDHSPEGSVHERPVVPAAATASAELSSLDPFFDIETPDSEQAIGGKVEEEEDYIADMNNYDNGYEHGGNEDSQFEAHLNFMSGTSGDPDGSSLSIEFPVLKAGNPGRPSHNIQYPDLNLLTINNEHGNGNLDLSLTLSKNQGEENGFTQHLRRWHRQDSERDELLKRLYYENVNLKRALKEREPGINIRAEAAERNLFEIRKTLDISPYVCVIVDGKGYKIHEELLQIGKNGGIEAADRLRTEVSNHLQQFRDSESWRIMVHLFIDVEGILARCSSNAIPMSDSSVRGFMLGFSQAQPLFTIADVGRDQTQMSRKVEAMLNVFADNVQCKHVILGCCHHAGYMVALEKYCHNPIKASGITLLRSYETSEVFEGLLFDKIEFPRTFRTTPYRETDRLAGDPDHLLELPQQPGAESNETEAEKSQSKEIAKKNEAITRWRANAGVPTLIPSIAPSPLAKSQSGWTNDRTVLLNINDERVDPELREVDYETSESMLDRMESRRLCSFYHLQNSCMTEKFGQTCKYTHGPQLKDDELRWLWGESRRRACDSGSQCRKTNCVYGHTCPDQPDCSKGSKCPLSRFHAVDKTAVRVLTPEKTLSPRKGWKI